jgi:hypothetical protein
MLMLPYKNKTDKNMGDGYMPVVGKGVNEHKISCTVECRAGSV